MTIWYHEVVNDIIPFIFLGKRRWLSCLYRQKMIRSGHLINSESGELNGVDRKFPIPDLALRVASWTYNKFICPPRGCGWLLFFHSFYTVPLLQMSQLYITEHLPFSAFQYLLTLFMSLSSFSFPLIPAHYGHLTNHFLSQSINGGVKGVHRTLQCALHARGPQGPWHRTHSHERRKPWNQPSNII